MQGISFSCCFDSYTDMCKIVDFFNQHHELFYPYSIIYSQIGKYNTTYYEYCDKAHEQGIIVEESDTLAKSIDILQKGVYRRYNR